MTWPIFWENREDFKMGAIVIDNRGTTIFLGKQGENEARIVKIRIQEMIDEYGAGSVMLVARRPGETEVYPVVTETEDGYVVWTIGAADVLNAGYGNAEVHYIIDEQIVKSVTYVTRIEPALSFETEVPAPYEAWVDQVGQYAIRAEEAEANTELALIATTDAKEEAEGARDQAGLYAEEAEDHAENAQTAKTGAEAAKTAAETAQNGAETAETGAQAARIAAEAAQEAAETAKADAHRAKTSAETAQGLAEAARDEAEAQAERAEAAAETVTPSNTDDVNYILGVI